jgi:hypothetical protein
VALVGERHFRLGTGTPDDEFGKTFSSFLCALPHQFFLLGRSPEIQAS